MNTIKTWAGAAGQNACQVLVYDNGYIYAGLATHPALVVKINSSDMSTLDTWEAPAGNAICFGLISDGSYLYAGIESSPALVVKIDPSDMSTVLTWTGALGQDISGELTLIGSDLYVGLLTTPAQVVKINSGTMTTIATWTGAAGQNGCFTLVSDGSCLYAGLYISPAQVVQINPSTMLTEAIWTGVVDQDYCYALAFRDSYVYAGLWTSPAQVVKVDISDMTTDLTWTGRSGQNRCSALAFDNTRLCVGLNLVPAQVIRVVPSTMTTEWVTNYTWAGDAGMDYCRALLFDGTYILVGLLTFPARVVAVVSDPELANFFPQHTRLHLGIRTGNVLWSALVNQSTFDAAVLEVAYDGASGDPRPLSQYIALYLFLREPPANGIQGVVKGFVKNFSVAVDSPTEGTFYFLYPKALNWEDNDVLQILDYIPLYAQPLVHSDAWDDAVPVSILGPDRMGFVDEPLEFIGEDSYARKGKTVTDYSWDFESGIPNTSVIAGTRENPIEITWDTAGEYIFSLQVQDSGGKVFTGYRSVLIYERTGANAPYDALRLRSISGDWESGGFSCSIEVFKDPTLADFPDHALVILLAEDWYGDYKVALGDELGAENQLFVGYIVAGSQTLDAETETIALEIATIDYLMERLNVWPESFKDGNEFRITSEMTQFVDLTLDDVAFHILEQHTTVRQTHDVHCDITNRLDYIPIGPATLFRVLNDQIFNLRFGKCVSSRLSNLWIAQDRQYEPLTAQEAHPYRWTLGRDRWLETVDLGEERAPDQVCQLGVTAFTRGLHPVVSYAPPLDPNWPAEGNWGGAEAITEVLVDDSAAMKKVAEADYFAGQALALRNIRYSRVEIQAANWRILDPARQDYFKLDLGVGDTLRGHNWSEERLICRGLTWESAPIQTIEGEPLVHGFPGGHVALDPELSTGQPLKDVMIIARHANNLIRAFFTQGFNEVSVSWTEFSTGLSTNEAFDIIQDPFNKYRVVYLGSYNSVYLWYAPFGFKGATWENILPLADFNVTIGASAPWYCPVRLETSEKKQGFIAVHAVYPHPADSSYLQSRVLISFDWGESWEASDPFSYGGSTQQYFFLPPGSPDHDHFPHNDLDGCRHSNGILYATAGRIKPGDWHSVVYKSTGWSVNFSQVAARSTALLSDSKGAIHVPYEDNASGLILYWGYAEEAAGTAPIILKSIDGGGSWNNLSNVFTRTRFQARVVDSHEKDHDRVVAYSSILNGNSGLYLSTDGGASWVFRQICDGVAGSGVGEGVLYDVKLWAVNQERILAGGETFLRVSGDQGLTWTDKIGDLEERLHADCRVLKILPNWGAQL